jgi:predicted nucleic acid-binding protein
LERDDAPASRNGFGLTASETESHVRAIEASMDFLSEGEDVYREWRSMVGLHNVLGAQVHDARLPATMMVHGIRHLLTFNTGDFKRYSSIVVIQPKEIIEESR